MHNPFIKYGLYYSILNIFSLLILYLIMPELIFNPYLGWIWMFVLLVFMVLAVAEKKRIGENFISLRSAFTESWLTFAIGIALSMLFNYILMNFIDPNLVEMQKDAQIAAVEKMAEFLNLSEDAVQKQIDIINNEAGPGPGKLFFGYIVTLLVAAIPAIIIAAIMKKSPEQID